MSRITVLDHGYVELVHSWGSEEGIIEAARMSTGKGFQGWGPIHTPTCDLAIALGSTPFVYGPDVDTANKVPCTCTPKPGDEKLIRFLYEHKHMTPFEMAGLTFEVQLPIFVVREWHRHRTQSFNEMSARYTPLPDLNYVPDIDRLMINAGMTNKQAGAIAGAKKLSPQFAEFFRLALQEHYAKSEDLYQSALNAGVPKELARIVLPVGRYTRMRASANLRNWLGFLALRLPEDAQWEIRQYAQAVAAEISKAFPRTYELFMEGLRK